MVDQAQFMTFCTKSQPVTLGKIALGALHTLEKRILVILSSTQTWPPPKVIISTSWSRAAISFGENCRVCSSEGGSNGG